MCLRPIYNVMIGFTASNFTLETLKIFYQQLWHTPGHRLAAEAGLMELSRALHLPGSIQSAVSYWVSELCLCTRHETVAGKWTYILLQYILWAVITEEHEIMLAASRGHSPELSPPGRDQFLIGNTCVGARWRDDITISEHIPGVGRLLWWDSPFISLKAPVSWCPLSTVKVFWARESLSASWNVIGFYGALKLRNSIDAVIWR